MAEDGLGVVDPMPAVQQAKRWWRPRGAAMPGAGLSGSFLRAVGRDLPSLARSSHCEWLGAGETEKVRRGEIHA